MVIRLLRLLRNAGRDLVILCFACRHTDTPKAVKLSAVLLLLYVISPLDLIPDWLPFVGWADDVTIAAAGISFLLKRLPEKVIDDARFAASGWLSRLRH